MLENFGMTTVKNENIIFPNATSPSKLPSEEIVIFYSIAYTIIDTTSNWNNYFMSIK